MFILAGGIILLAVTALALRIDDRSAHRARTGITLGILTALVLLTIGVWTTLTDTHNIHHWILKVLITLITATITVASIIMLRTNPRTVVEQETP